MLNKCCFNDSIITPCCGNVGFDTSLQSCCQDQIFTHSSQSCCFSKIINNSESTCCFDKIIKISNINCSLININLTHYWPFDSHLADVIGDSNLHSGNNYNFTSGRYSQAISLTNGSIMIPEGQYFRYNMFTIMAWIKLSQIIPGARVFEFYSNSTSVLLITSNDRFLYGVRSLNGALLSSYASLKIGQWTHLALTFGQNKKLNLFVDGKLDSHGTAPQKVLTDTIFSRNYIGGGLFKNGTKVPNLNALVDEVKIFDYDLQLKDIVNEIK